MHVRTGWSGETQSNVWQKADIQLGEEDLNRLLLEAGLPEQISARLPVVIVYELLQSQAEILLLRKLITLGYPQDKALARVNELASLMASIIASAHDKIAEGAEDQEAKTDEQPQESLVW